MASVDLSMKYWTSFPVAAGLNSYNGCPSRRGRFKHFEGLRDLLVNSLRGLGGLLLIIRVRRHQNFASLSLVARQWRMVKLDKLLIDETGVF